MQQVNLHKAKLYSLIIVAAALIGMFLTWTTVKYPAAVQQQLQNFGNGLQNQMGGLAGGGQAAGTMELKVNAFKESGWAYLSMVGVAGVLAVIFLLGDKTRDFDQQSKNLAMLSFAAVAAGALIYKLSNDSAAKDNALLFQQRGITYSYGIGLWVTLAAGVIGVLWVAGILNKLGQQQTATNTPVSTTNPIDLNKPTNTTTTSTPPNNPMG